MNTANISIWIRGSDIDAKIADLAVEPRGVHIIFSVPAVRPNSPNILVGRKHAEADKTARCLDNRPFVGLDMLVRCLD